MKFLNNIIHLIEKLYFYFFYCLYFFLTKKNIYDWTLGVTENCKNIYYFNKIIKNSYSVCLNPDVFTPEIKYDFLFEVSQNKYLNKIKKFLVGPILFAKLSHQSKNFLYFWNDGFLLFDDNREFQFKFLKKKNKKVACFFCGSEIRSYKLSIKLEKKFKLDNQIRYRLMDKKFKEIDIFEQKIKKFCEIVDNYADIVFNYETDQISYLKKKCYPFFYNFEAKKFPINLKKFNNLNKIKIVHAPSNPTIKGTPIIRAAIQNLKNQNYNIEYKELINLKNSEVIRELKKSHIVINELYGYSPGLFSIEGMFNSCMVMTSASEKYETMLPKRSSNHWVTVSYLNLEKKLKFYLNRKEKIKFIAKKGYIWANENANINKNMPKINKILNK